ncbi:MAG: helix-hairpin-helix domain-containing protein [Gemmatimonadales bacterium]
MSGSVVGLEFCATLLPRTPHWILEHHGEIWRDKAHDPPNYGSAADGLWFMALSSRSETSTEPSKGPPEYDRRVHLSFFRQFRTIVEAPVAAELQVAEVTRLIQSDSRFIHLATFFRWELPRSFFVERLMDLDGVGPKLALRLFDSGFVTPEAVATATDEQLSSVQGIGQQVRAKIRSSHVRPVIWPPNPK